MQRDDLRRIQRVKVCCRVDARDRFGVWTAVTEDLCAQGCGLVTPTLPRVGSMLELTLWSDLFPEPLEVSANAAWASDRRVGVTFVATESRLGRLSPADWIERIIEHGRVLGPEAVGSDVPRVVPVVVRRSGAAARGLEQRHAVHEGVTRVDPESGVLILPVAQR